MYQVTGYDELRTVLKDWRTFSSRGTVNSRQEEILAFTDPPRHDRQRQLFSRAFSARAVSQVEEEIQTFVDELIERVSQQRSFDLVADFAQPLVLAVVARLLGVPSADIERFQEWTAAAERSSYSPTEADRTLLREFRTYSTDLITRRRHDTDPPQDLLTALMQAEWEEDRLTDREISNTLEFLLVAANSTTTSAIGNLVWALETHPAQKAMLMSSPEERIGGAVEEILRWDGPIHALQRTVTKDTTLGVVQIPAESVMVNVYGACSRDPQAFDRPDEFCIDRDWGSIPNHYGFGWGTHFCLGAHLARREIAVAVTTLYRRLPGLRIAIGFSPRQIPAPFLRGWQRLDVEFDNIGEQLDSAATSS